MAFNGVVTADSPVAPDYGLFSVARVQNRGSGDEHWVSGYSVETVLCGSSTQTFPVCAPANEWVDTFVGGADQFFNVVPFAILETWACENSVGYNAVDRRATVVRQLKNSTEYAVERELWIGTNAQTDTNDIPAERWLANAQNVTQGGAVRAALALALVEQAFYENNPGVQATIHMTPLVAAVLNGQGLQEENDKIFTFNGSRVAISRGGIGEEGPAAGGSDTAHWVYATGPVHVDLGSDELITVSASEIVDAKTNKVAYVAERPAAVYFDGCSWFGALADATL